MICATRVDARAKRHADASSNVCSRYTQRLSRTPTASPPYRDVNTLTRRRWSCAAARWWTIRSAAVLCSAQNVTRRCSVARYTRNADHAKCKDRRVATRSVPWRAVDARRSTMQTRCAGRCRVTQVPRATPIATRRCSKWWWCAQPIRVVEVIAAMLRTMPP